MKTLILVVDDDGILGVLLGRLLARKGCTVIPAKSGEEALELARQHRPRLVVIDMWLPDGNGLGLADQLKAEFPALDLLLMADPWYLERHPELLDAFSLILAKPIDLAELRQAIVSYLEPGKNRPPAVPSLARLVQKGTVPLF
jgi:DNA-binding NtrC family response regulator